jgi:hypothetical protein
MEATIAAVLTVGWKWAAILIGLGALVLLDFAVFLGCGTWNPWKIVLGEDKRPSTSKFQWFLWLTVVLFAYVTLWVIRARGGDYSALPDIPVNVMAVLGISTGTAAIAKGIAVANAPRRAAAAAARAAAPGATLAGPAPQLDPPAGEPAHGLLVDDSTNLPDIAKVQMVGFTFVALGIFLATLFHQIASAPVTTTLPDIDSTLLVLMGISQGGYLAKKLTSGTG